jgi:GNAT superfamily N-acetyltransferase
VEQVRTAVVSDVDRLVELVGEFRSAAADQRGAVTTWVGDPGGSLPAASAAAVAPYLSDAGRTALVGSLDDWVAGMALCRVDSDGGGRRGVLDACFVEPGAREVGLGRLLLDTALVWFRAEGCTGVDGSALPGDRDAKQFFESAGFKARLLVMHLSLE